MPQVELHKAVSSLGGAWGQNWGPETLGDQRRYLVEVGRDLSTRMLAGQGWATKRMIP